jgi:hypothetical protein
LYPGNYAFGEITNSDFDSYNGLQFDGGEMRISNSYFTVGGAYFGLKYTNKGVLSVSNCNFYIFSSGVGAPPLVDINFTSGDLTNSVILNGGWLNAQGIDIPAFSITSGANAVGNFRLANYEFYKLNSATYTKPVIQVVPGAGAYLRTNLNNLRVNALVGGSGYFYSIQGDTANTVSNITAPNWLVTYPARANNYSTYADGNGKSVSYGTTQSNFFGYSSQETLNIVDNTITPTRGLVAVNGGGGLLKTITLPYTGFIGCIELIPNSAFTTDTTGNIGKESTAVTAQLMRLCYNGFYWIPSY